MTQNCILSCDLISGVLRCVDGMIDFNGILTCLGLFYAWGLGNLVNCTFIFIFFAHDPIEYEL